MLPPRIRLAAILTAALVVGLVLGALLWRQPTANGSYRLEYATDVSHDDGMAAPVTREASYYVPPAPRIAAVAPARHSAPSIGSGRCGGDLPPCWVMMRESRGNVHAYNATGCSGRGCNGKWQCDPRTCDGTGTEAQQDAEASRVWDGGRGCSHWAAC